ncbi:hypothetical protein MtrunA17_Chr1g0166531 [Medicago truncatula]|uniref:Uncharacterized protein n=1 Tax=Medicago truncatula TaxID=3880 RepID=A0A072VHI0_MEDTR|nr:hypothetical protein MTR_1g041525 [Medicago truncatula]RHN78522.1 hypothetical protein MtrunA17_Chr1g0166531 [Medicago truncatula]
MTIVISFAFPLFFKILKMGGYHPPDAITFTTLFKGLCLNGDIYKTLHLKVMLAAHLQFCYHSNLM